MMEVIRARGLTQKFGDNTAVNSLTLTVNEGEVFGLVGPDGAGKTTVMRLLAGLMAPSAGDAWVYGCHTVNEAEKLRTHISYMPQRFGLYPDLTVQENIDFYADLYNVSRKERKDKIAELLAFSNMTPFRERQARNLSGGMFPIANMPEVVQAFTYLNPLRYFLIILRGIFLKGAGVTILWPQILALFVLGSLVLTLAVKRFHKNIA